MQRRAFLKSTAATSAAVLLNGPSRPFAFLGSAVAAEGAAAQSTTEQKFADLALSIRYDDLPADVVAAAKRALLDTLGCAFGAVGSEPGEIAEATIRKTFGAGEDATIIGYARRATLEGALFVNGVLVRSLDLNDTYLGTDPLHPSELIPTALALSEERRVSGKVFLEAMIAGYEASMRVNDAISFMERGFHPLCAAAYGVPVMAGKIWGLPRDAIANAVGVSGARGFTSFVVNSGAISMMKAMGLAATAADGVFVTRLAAQGFTGPSGTLEWLGSKMSPRKENFSIDLEPTRYRMPRVSFKRFPVQIELQAVAEAGVTLAKKLKASGASVRAITVATYPGIIERVADAPKFNPQTKGTADHSLPVCLALALVDGDVSTVQFEKDRWRDRDVMDLVAKTSVKLSEPLMQKLPKGRGAVVELVLTNGEVLTETVEIPEGDPQRPLSNASLESKYTNFATPVVGASDAAKIVSLVANLESVGDMRELTGLLGGARKDSSRN